nr:MAG TPA_asm: hypothetical protein [Caudoviricetes sp.]
MHRPLPRCPHDTRHWLPDKIQRSWRWSAFR